MKRILSLCLLLVMALVLIGCSTKAIKVQGAVMGTDRPMKGALVEFIMPEPRLPYMPLIPAGVYRNKFLDHRAEIREAHTKRVDKFADMVGKAIAERCGMPFEYGEDLIQSDDYQSLASKGVTIYPPAIANKHFPELVMATGHHNFIDFSAVKQTNLLLYKEKYTSDNMARVCKALGLDYAVIAVVSAPSKSGSYNRGVRYLQLELYYFNTLGHMTLSVYSTSEAQGHHAHAVDQYEAMLDMLGPQLDEVMATVYKGPA